MRNARKATMKSQNHRFGVTLVCFAASTLLSSRTDAQTAAAQSAEPAQTTATQPVEPAQTAAPRPEPAIAAPPVAHPATSGHAEPAATVSAEFGHGATIRTADERFSLTIRGRIQTRFTVTDLPGAPQMEFQVRRMRMVFLGNFFGPDFNYYIQLAFSNLDTESDLRLPLRDAYAAWTGVRDLNVRAGQMKVPFGRQRVVSSSALQFADRSGAVSEFNLDRDVGVVLFSRDLFGLGRRLNYQLGVFGGDGRNRLSDTYGLLYVGRVQVQPFGEFDDLTEADTQRLPTPRLAVGLAAAFNQHSRRSRSTTGDTLQQPFDYVQLAADLQLKWAGFSLQAEGLYRRASEDSHVVGMNASGPVTEWSRSGVGAYVQAGYLFTRNFELAARWSEIFPFAGTSPSLHASRELGGGLSWYAQRHDLKLQADYFYLTADNYAEGRHQVRVQAQVYF